MCYARCYVFFLGAGLTAVVRHERYDVEGIHVCLKVWMKVHGFSSGKFSHAMDLAHQRDTVRRPRPAAPRSQPPS